MYCTGHAIEVEGPKEKLNGPEEVTYCDYYWDHSLYRHPDSATILSQRHAGNHRPSVCFKYSISLPMRC